MACLNLSNGQFTNLAWSNTNFNGGNVTITRTPTSITVERVGFATALNLNGDFRSAVFGAGQFIALLNINSGGDRTVYLVDATGASLTTAQVHQQIGVTSAAPLPVIAMSPGSGSLLFVWSSTGTVGEANTLSIVRSDNGDTVLYRLGPVSSLTQTPFAEITSTQLIIHNNNTFSTTPTTGPRPAGSLTVTPASQPFGQAVIGASNPALATVTRTFTLKNDGDDCLDVTGITDTAPYRLTPASRALLPIRLEPGQTRTVDVVFAPTAVGTFNLSLTVSRTPANGATALVCQGSARLAVASIATSTSAINFLTIPYPGTAQRPLTVTNNGDLDLTISILAAPAVPAPPATPAFTWTTANLQTLAVGGTFPITVIFTPEGDFASAQQILTVTPSLGTARSVTINGAGCVANAAIALPAIAPLDFAQIERGFRTVRFIEITNTGDGDLTFRARITAGANPAQAANFGLVLIDNDITDAPPLRTYAVLPTTRCGPGPTGPNVTQVAVGFFADGASGSYGANLVIDSHNATNFGPAQSWTFPLVAEVIDPVPVDAVLVLDKSGSMANSIGTRNKMEAARAGAGLFVQMLRDSADDRAALVGFDTAPNVVQAIVPVAGNRALLSGAITGGGFNPGGWTNLAGGVIFGRNQFTPHPANPPVLKKSMIVLTDGIENRCLQDGGSQWFSITGRDANDPPEGMYRPDGTPQDSDPLPTPAGIKVYGIGLGNPGQIDGAALNALSSATGAAYQGVVQLTGRDYFLLEKYFTQIFMDSAGLAQIADPFFTINPGDRHRFEFDIFPGDVNAMVVLYDSPGKRLPFFIVSPSGEVLSGTSLPPGFAVRYRSTPTARFVDFFFPNREPDRYAGRWTVIVEHDNRVCDGPVSGGAKDEQGDDVGGDVGDGFTPRKCRRYHDPVDYGIAIAAGSNLRMQPYVDPAQKFIGDPIALWADIAEAGLPVTGATVKVRVETPFGATYNLTLRDDGASGDGQADDGEYGGTFGKTFAAGEYRFFFRAEGVQAGKVPIAWVREAERTKAVYDKRAPLTSDDPKATVPGGGGDPCCPRRLLRLLEADLRADRKLGREHQGTPETRSVARRTSG